jgi:hypothetical protein
MSVVNGSFTSYMLSANNFTYFGPYDYIYIPGWTISNVAGFGTFGPVLSNGASAWGSAQPAGQQCFIVQFSAPPLPAVLRLTQSISFNAGNYTLSFRARHREALNTVTVLSVSISNGGVFALSSQTAGLSKTLFSFQTFTYNFSVTSTGPYVLQFLYSDPSGSGQVFLTDVQIATNSVSSSVGGSYNLFGNFDRSYSVTNQVTTPKTYKIDCASSNGKNLISFQGISPNHSIFYSTNYGQTWAISAAATYSGSYGFSRLICSPRNFPDVFYVASTTGNLLRSSNGGVTWSIKASGYTAINGICVNDADTIFYLSNSNNGLYYSTNASTGTFTFTQITNSALSYAYSQIVCSSDGLTLFGSASTSNRVFKYNYSVTSSLAFSSALGVSVSNNVAMSLNGTYLYATLENSSNSLLRSADGGATYSSANVGTGLPSNVTDLFPYCDPTGKYVQVVYGSNWYISSDYGVSFSLYTSSIPTSSTPAVFRNNNLFITTVQNTNTQYGTLTNPTPYTGTAPTITNVTTQGSTITIAFTAGSAATPSVTTYYYSIDGGNTYTNAAKTTSPIVISSGLQYGINYQIVLKAYNGSMFSYESNTMSSGFIEYPCFLQGSRILCMNPETDDEEYVPIETLRRGDLVKTRLHGYKAIAYIGHSILKYPESDPNKKNRLYRFPKSKISGMTEDLYITGEHCTLHSHVTEEILFKTRDHMGDIYVTERMIRVPACLDERAEPYISASANRCGSGNKGSVTIWHLALEHNNAYHNYGIWANGLLVESCSIEHLVNRSNMELM